MIRETNSEEVEKIDVSELIDSTDEDFKKFINELDLGFTNNLLNFFTMQFNGVKKIKDELVERMSKGIIPKNEENLGVLNSLYPKLQSLESKVFLLRNRSESLSKELPNV